jgi:ABC-type multidrug transport system ATPase subunit
MCTHLLSEAEGLADHVVMMEGGTAMISGTPEELTRRFWPNPIVRLAAEDGRLLDRVAAWPGVAAYRRDPAGARLELDDLGRLPDMIASLCADGARLTAVEPHVPTLEDLYFTIRRQAGGSTVTEDDAAAGGRRPLEPIRARWGTAEASTPPLEQVSP